MWTSRESKGERRNIKTMQMTEGAVRIKPSEHWTDVELGKKEKENSRHSGRIKSSRRFLCGQEPLCLPDPVRRMCNGRSRL